MITYILYIPQYTQLLCVCVPPRKGRQQELQARLLEAERSREEVQRIRDELQMPPARSSTNRSGSVDRIPGGWVRIPGWKMQEEGEEPQVF